MGTGTALAIDLVIAALQHATEIQQLIATANSQGRDVTQDELNAVRTKAVAAVAALEAATR